MKHVTEIFGISKTFISPSWLILPKDVLQLRTPSTEQFAAHAREYYDDNKVCLSKVHFGFFPKGGSLICPTQEGLEYQRLLNMLVGADQFVRTLRLYNGDLSQVHRDDIKAVIDLAEALPEIQRFARRFFAKPNSSDQLENYGPWKRFLLSTESIATLVNTYPESIRFAISQDDQVSDNSVRSIVEKKV